MSIDMSGFSTPKVVSAQKLHEDFCEMNADMEWDQNPAVAMLYASDSGDNHTILGVMEVVTDTEYDVPPYLLMDTVIEESLKELEELRQAQDPAAIPVGKLAAISLFAEASGFEVDAEVPDEEIYNQMKVAPRREAKIVCTVDVESGQIWSSMLVKGQMEKFEDASGDPAMREHMARLASKYKAT
jgi:hypothetical protein